MSLPTTPVTVTGILPSYLYFQYQNDPDLPALIDAYNTIAQEYLDWFNEINLPIYTGLQGALLDWVGQGIYGITRPKFSTSSVTGIFGPIASVPYVGPESGAPNPNIGNAISSTQLYGISQSFDTPDDIYKRVLTWFFYKGDGFDFSIPWLKRRIARFLYGDNGTDVSMPFTPNISVTFDDSTTPLPTCTITVTGSSLLEPTATYFEAAVEAGVLSLPFRYAYVVTLS